MISHENIPGGFSVAYSGVELPRLRGAYNEVHNSMLYVAQTQILLIDLYAVLIKRHK